MDAATTAVINLDQVAITLSTIAYLGVDKTPVERFTMMMDALKDKELPTKQQWGLVWGPVEHDGFLMYIAQGPATQFARHYAVVIRGTVKSAWDIFVDLDTPGMSDIPWPAPDMPGAQLGWGVIDTWLKLKGMRTPSNGKTAVEFLKTVESTSAVIVTGHSLGGQMASAVASWLRSELNQPIKTVGITPITFAGPTAGNAAFADPYARIFPTGKRFFNENDIVPRFWNYDDIASIYNLYPGPTSPKCDAENGCYAAIEFAQHWADHYFMQTGGGVKLPSQLYNESMNWFQFVDEVEAQHSSMYYMYLLGIQPGPIRKLFPDKNWNPPGVQ